MENNVQQQGGGENSPLLPDNEKDITIPAEMEDGISPEDSFTEQSLGPILLPFSSLDTPDFDFSKFIDEDTPVLVSVKEKGWRSDVFQTYMDLDIADLAVVAAENLSHQFQSVELTQPWRDYLSQTLGPYIWGQGDMYTLDSVKDMPQHLPQQIIPKSSIQTVATQLTQNQQHDRKLQQQQQHSIDNIEAFSQAQAIMELGTALRDAEEACRNVKAIFSPKVLTGGTTSIQSFLQFLSNADCGSVRYVMFAHGRVGDEGEKDSSALHWLIMCGKCKAKVDGLIKKYASLQKIPLSEIKNEGITVFRVEQWEGDLLVIPPNCVCHAATSNGHVAVVSWLRQVPKTLSMLYERYVLPNYHDPSNVNSVVVPVKFSIARSLNERINQIISERECSDVVKQDIEMLIQMLKNIIFEEKIINRDTFYGKRQKLQPDSQVEGDIAMVPYEDNSRFLVCSLCKAYILSYFFVCQMCGASQGGRPALYCPSCVCESFHCGHTESFLLCKTSCTIEYLENILVKARRQFPEAYSRTEDVYNGEVLPYMTVAFTMLYDAKSDVHATCHQCKLSKTLDKLAFCTSLLRDTRKKKGDDKAVAETATVMKPCTKKYCNSCLWNRYMVRISDCLRYSTWECPFCKGECNCSACLKKRGVNPSSLEMNFTSRNAVGQTHKPPRPRIRRKAKGVADDDLSGKEKEDDNLFSSFVHHSLETITKRTVLNENTQRRESPFCVTVGNLVSVPARDLTQNELTTYGLRDLDKSYVPVFLIKENIVTLVKPQMISTFSSIQILPHMQQSSSFSHSEQNPFLQHPTVGLQSSPQQSISMAMQLPIALDDQQQQPRLHTQNEIEQILLQGQQQQQQQHQQRQQK